MLFSFDWLQSCCPVDSTVEQVAEALTSRGLTVDAVTAAGDDWALDVDIPANRPDCLGHRGLAREISAALGFALVAPETPDGDVEDAATEWVRVRIDDPALCTRYTAGRVRGVEIGPSPDWVAQRLAVCGLRTINNVVDASNLVMLELGHPVHFFDYGKLADGDEVPEIVVRLAAKGERIETLDGVKRELDAATLVIADAHRPLALAGVIGGANTEVTDETTDVLIEAARFDPISVRATARRLGAQTDASFRFERGVDPETALTAQAMARRLLVELAQGKPESVLVDAHPGRAAAARLTLRTSEVQRLLGYQPGPAAIEEALRALQLQPRQNGDESVEITVPSWRIDLELEADLVEEVARHIGYDEIPTSTARMGLLVESGRSTESEDARDILASLGFHEAFGYAMIAPDEDLPFIREGGAPPAALRNPIAEQMSHLRRSILPGLLRATELNLRRGTRDVRLFECGHVFLPREPAGPPLEPAHLGIAWAGCPAPGHWSRSGRELDLYDVMGLVERVLCGLRPGIELTRDRPAGPAGFHPLNGFCWRAPDGEALAWGGTLHPEIQQRIDAPVFLAEIDLDAVGRIPATPSLYAEIPRVPAVTRDVAIVTAGEKSYDEVLAALRAVESPAPATFAALDRYEGPPLADGEASLTLRVTLRPLTRTLTDPETEQYRQSLMKRLEGLSGVRIRT